MADCHPTAPNPSAASDAEARLALLDTHLGQMIGAARVLRSLTDNLADEEGVPPRLLESLEWLAGSLSRDINAALDICDPVNRVEILQARIARASA